MKIILLDYISPTGHISLINFYINKFHKRFQKIILNQKIKKSFNFNKKIKYLSIKDNSILKIVKLYFLFKEFKEKKISKIIMLSYEPKIIFFLQFFIDLEYFNLYLLEHDNLSNKKFLKIIFIKNLPKKIIHLTYSLPAKIFLNSRLNRKSIFINHPIIIKSKNKDTPSFSRKFFNKINSKTILIPTRHHMNEKHVNNILNKYNNINFILLLKKSDLIKKKFSTYKNALTIEKISENDISKVCAIYLPLKNKIYEFRVSAWLYRGIGFGKIIIMENTSLFQFEKKRFPNHIVKINDKIFYDVMKFKLNKKINNKFVKNYNQHVIKNFESLLNK
jgi:hypothetical protein